MLLHRLAQQDALLGPYDRVSHANLRGAFGAAWELPPEFPVNYLFGMHLLYGLDDTMYDLISDGIGGGRLVVAGAGAFCLSWHEGAIVPSVVHEDPSCARPAGW